MSVVSIETKGYSLMTSLKTKAVVVKYLNALTDGGGESQFKWNLEQDYESLTWVMIKLMRLGVTNQIVDDSDSKPVNFDRRFRSDSKSNDKFELTIAIWI